MKNLVTAERNENSPSLVCSFYISTFAVIRQRVREKMASRAAQRANAEKEQEAVTQGSSSNVVALDLSQPSASTSGQATSDNTKQAKQLGDACPACSRLVSTANKYRCWLVDTSAKNTPQLYCKGSRNSAVKRQEALSTDRTSLWFAPFLMLY